ncbi:MAG: GtrA family protein, partial [Zoogloeaceae bacterium]|nr:GtrA family protein [Zoogloeaceae bacterium]
MNLCVGIWEKKQGVRFLAIGAWNTIFGYFMFVVLYGCFGTRSNYLGIAVANHFIAVLNAFIFHRYVVFRSKNNIVREFLRFNISYVITLVFGLVLIFILVENMDIHPILGQGITTPACVALTYFAHKYFSFGQTNMNAEEQRH